LGLFSNFFASLGNKFLPNQVTLPLSRNAEFNVRFDFFIFLLFIFYFLFILNAGNRYLALLAHGTKTLRQKGYISRLLDYTAIATLDQWPMILV